jgi:GH24 family phage-related lysozyme (muramidase)
MLVNGKQITFLEYYVLEESLKDDVSKKWDEIKNFLLTKDTWGDPANTRKLKSLQEELIQILKNIKQINSDIVLAIIDQIIINPIKKINFMPGRKGSIIRFLMVFIPHLLIALGIKEAYERKKERYANITSIEASAQQQQISPKLISPEIEKKAEEETKKIIERIWGNFKGREDFVNMVKAFEAGDIENLNIKPKPLPAYWDRNQMSIGFGTKAKPNEDKGHKISEIEAHNRLIEELTTIESQVKEMLAKKKWKVNTNQLNGFIDFAFNRGPNALNAILTSSKNIDDCIAQIRKVVYSRTTNEEKPKFNKQLNARRIWEISLLKQKPVSR